MTQDRPADRVAIVTVCFNSTGVLADMLATIPEGCQVILSDNGSSDLVELQKIAAEYGAELVLNQSNLGFGRACNTGAAIATRELILFQNPDARLDENAISELVRAADHYPDAVAFNPAIRNANGSKFFKRGSCLLPAAQKLPRGWPDRDREVAVLSGASLMVRKADFDAVGGFDAAIFLYHEDDDLSLRMTAGGGKLMFVRQAQVTHAQGTSTTVSPATAALKAYHMGRSRVYASRKHGRPLAFSRALLLACWQLCSPLVLLSRRKRAKQWAFLQGVLTSSQLGLATEG